MPRNSIPANAMRAPTVGCRRRFIIQAYPLDSIGATPYTGGMSTSIPKRRAVQILRQAGYRLESTGKHELWTNGEHTITLPLAPHSDLWGFMAQQIHRIEQGEGPPKARRKR